MLDATYLGLTISDWRMLAVVISGFAVMGVLSTLRDHRPPRPVPEDDGDGTLRGRPP